jgi:hypothetical protein
MRSIRKFAYAAALIATVFCVQPTLVAAEDARGKFTLTHEVRWQSYVLPPGDYSFSVRSLGGSEYLMLRGRNGTGTEATLMANDVETPKADDVSRLVLVSRNGQSFISAMELPESDMILNFAVPPAVPPGRAQK